MSDPLDLPLVLTVEEAAEVLRISRGSAYEAIRANEIPHVRIGRTIRVPRHALLSLLLFASGSERGDGPGLEPAGMEEDGQVPLLTARGAGSSNGGGT